MEVDIRVGLKWQPGIVLTVNKLTEKTYELNVQVNGKNVKSKWPGQGIDYCGQELKERDCKEGDKNPKL